MSPVYMQVPVLSMIFFVINLIVSLAIPVVLFIVFHKKYGCKAVPFFLGAAAFIVFVVILENGCHFLFGLNDPSSPILSNTWLYAVYGGSMAGLFEETGRFVIMKFFLKKYHGNDHNALMYGAGHGGIEAVLVLGSVSLNNILYSFMINAGMTDTILDSLPDEMQKTQLLEIFRQLKESDPPIFLVASLERLSAVAFHLAMSVLVWFAVTRKGKIWMYPAAIVIHAAFDGSMVLVAGFTGSTFAAELFILVFTAVTCFIVYNVWKKIRNNTDQGEMT